MTDPLLTFLYGVLGGLVVGFFMALVTTTIDRKTLEAQLRKKWGIQP